MFFDAARRAAGYEQGLLRQPLLSKIGGKDLCREFKTVVSAFFAYEECNIAAAAPLSGRCSPQLHRYPF